MKLEEAIKVLETAPILHVDDIYPREHTALAMAIEALKDLKEFRIEFPNTPLLPGETEK
jgi:hypothetical protein